MVHLSNRLGSATFLDQLVDTRLVERGWERGPIKRFLHQGLSVAQHELLSGLGPLETRRPYGRLPRQGRGLARSYASRQGRSRRPSSQFRGVPPRSCSQSHVRFFLSHFFLSLQPCHAPFLSCFDSPTGGGLWPNKCLLRLFLFFAKNLCG